MPVHDDIIKPSSTSDLGSAYRAEGSSCTDRETAELEGQRQDSLPELPLLRKTQSTPITSSSGNTPELARGRRKSPFKIDLPPRNLHEFIDSYEQVEFLRFAGTRGIEHPVTIVQEPSNSESISTFHLTSLEEPQLPPLEILLSEVPSSFTVPQLDAASMASIDSDVDTGLFESKQSNEVTSVKLDLDSVVMAVADQLAQENLTISTLDIVHQPLPFPLPSQFSGITSPTASLFSRLIDALRHESRLKASNVRIQHVLTNNMLPENYPISPLVTPSSLARNSDQHGYFAVKTLFSSVTTSTGVALPPGQAQVCITERIIPPSGEVEMSSFLSDTTDSGFMIRLNELAQGGIFVLALPTSHGGRTFHNNCLSKILDPILRSIVFRLGLQSELAKDISNAIVLKQLLTFEQLQSKIQTILSTANTTAYFPGARPSFSLIQSTKGTISLPFECWYTWWLGQERNRIMGLLNYHLNVRSQGISASASILTDTSSSTTRSSIMLELDKEMRKAGSDQRSTPDIEVAVFMIQRVE